MKILLGILWIVPIPFICICVFPLLPLSMLADAIIWILTGKNQEILWKMWDYPPMKWVDQYLSIKI